MSIKAGSTLYKDFIKEPTDIIKKNYSKAGSWKLESKFKGPKNSVFVNPQCDNGRMSADVEYYFADKPLKLKVNVAADSQLKFTTAYEDKGHKVEAIVGSNGAYEVSHNGVVGGLVNVNSKLTQDVVEVGTSVAVTPELQVGCGSTYLMKGSNCQWTVGCRYAVGGGLIGISTAQLQSYNVSLMAALPIDYPVKVAVNSMCTPGQGWDATVGFETECYLMKGNKSRLRITKNGEWCVGYIAKLADRWTAAITLDKDLKAGIILTHE